MNKILRFSLVAVLALVANVMSAEAYKTLSFPDEGDGGKTISGYTLTWKAQIGKDTWTLVNFNSNKWGNNWKWVKCGSKKAASVGTIATDFAIDKAISYVVLSVDQMTKSKINSIKVVTATDADFKTGVEEKMGDLSALSAGSDFAIKTDAAAGRYFKVVIDCAKGSGNGLISIKSVSYYENYTPAVSETNTPETAYTVSEALDRLQKIVAGKLINDEVYIKGKISKVTEVSPKVGESGYGNATYTISADGTEKGDQLIVYRGYYLNGEVFTAEDQIKVGDEVVVLGKLKKYNDDSEIDSGSKIYSINGSTTGIGTVAVEDNANAPVFNLAGQRVNAAAKGLVIKNGKKYLNK